MVTMSAREFNHDVSSAKRAAEHAPVFITDRGRPSHVLLSVDEYRTLIGADRSLAESLALPESADFEPAVLDFEAKIPEL
nr:type II toxin-antitoxin system Phd/YefM family antitoxin [Jiangella aurantiaca]